MLKIIQLVLRVERWNFTKLMWLVRQKWIIGLKLLDSMLVVSFATFGGLSVKESLEIELVLVLAEVEHSLPPLCLLLGINGILVVEDTVHVTTYDLSAHHFLLESGQSRWLTMTLLV